MVLKFEKDLDALEELTIHVVKDSMLEAYSADNDFVISIYGITASGAKELVESVHSDIIMGFITKFYRWENGNLTVEHEMHGDDVGTPVPADATYISNRYKALVILGNTDITVRYHER